METTPRKTATGKSFFQNPQKLTFALGLVSGLAVMAIVGFVVIVVNGTSAKNTNAVADAQFDAATIAKKIGLNQKKFKSCLTSAKYKTAVTASESEGTSIGVSGTPTTFVNGTAISGALPYSDLKKAIDDAIGGKKGDVNVPAVRSTDHIIGSPSAKVLMVEYSDFQCPYCKQFNSSVQQALSEYKDQIAFVYRHFPLLSLHPYAESLAEGSECATELGGQSKFWEYHDKVFAGSTA